VATTPGVRPSTVRGGRRGEATLSGMGNVDPAMIVAVDSASQALVNAFGRAEEAVLSRVSVSQLRALRIIDRHGKINLSQLAEELGAIPSSASRLCDRLVAAGLLHRRTNAADRREVELTTTMEGERLIQQLRERRHRELCRVFAAMSAEGRRALLIGLQEFSRRAGDTDTANHEVA